MSILPITGQLVEDNHLPSQCAHFEDPLHAKRSYQKVEVLALRRRDGDIRQPVLLSIRLREFENFVGTEKEAIVVHVRTSPVLFDGDGRHGVAVVLSQTKCCWQWGPCHSPASSIYALRPLSVLDNALLAHDHDLTAGSESFERNTGASQPTSVLIQVPPSGRYRTTTAHTRNDLIEDAEGIVTVEVASAIYSFWM